MNKDNAEDIRDMEVALKALTDKNIKDFISADVLFAELGLGIETEDRILATATLMNRVAERGCREYKIGPIDIIDGAGLSIWVFGLILITIDYGAKHNGRWIVKPSISFSWKPD